MAGLFHSYAGGSVSTAYNDSFSPALMDMNCHYPAEQAENCETGKSFVAHFGLPGCQYHPDYFDRYFVLPEVPDDVEGLERCSVHNPIYNPDSGPTEVVRSALHAFPSQKPVSFD